MPREHWPAIAQHWSEARSFRAMAENLESCRSVRGSWRKAAGSGDMPLVVLSAGGIGGQARPPSQEHVADARLSSRGEHGWCRIRGTGCNSTRPEAVVDAIGRVVAKVRAQMTISRIAGVLARLPVCAGTFVPYRDPRGAGAGYRDQRKRRQYRRSESARFQGAGRRRGARGSHSTHSARVWPRFHWQSRFRRREFRSPRLRKSGALGA